ncbi:NepR family anti-sigma factor [Novosphingobium sp.]|uniref:NepR family anti-sigma factor n=1 Tax=Novosphingobium sp. TaxID=1874826 RepID=UPI0025E5140E|nr:NepR family anti-sigma factor [Novosphingobium sp.]
MIDGEATLMAGTDAGGFDPPVMETHVGHETCNGCGDRNCPHCAEQAGKGWLQGLRQLYDAVVREPLPDSFNQLLRQLDQARHD